MATTFNVRSSGRPAIPLTAVFDLGGVVVQWDPVLAVAAGVGYERALRFVHGDVFDFSAWNQRQDSGRTWSEAEAWAVSRYPSLTEEICAYRPNFALSLQDLVPGMMAVLRALHANDVRLIALTNWSAETFPHAPERFPEAFSLFDDMVVSGVEGVVKPDSRIFARLAERLGHSLQDLFFVDDHLPNVEAARRVGMDAVHFTDAPTLTADLRARGLIE